MKKFFIKYREIIITTIFVLVVAALGYWVIFGMFKEISSNRNAIESEILNREIKEKKMLQLSGVKQQYDLALDASKQLDVLVAQDSAVYLIEALEKLAAETGNAISIDLAQANDSQSKTKVKNEKEQTIESQLPSQTYLQMTITLSGSFSDVVTFIKKVELMKYSGDITSVQLQSKNDNDEDVKPEVTAQIFSNPIPNPQPEKIKTLQPKRDGNMVNASINAVFYMDK